MRTSESKELQQLLDLSSGFEFEVPITNLARDTDRNFKFAAHEQACDPAFDARFVYDGAGAGSDSHAGQGRNEQQRACP
jgi:hypothetical protein